MTTFGQLKGGETFRFVDDGQRRPAMKLLDGETAVVIAEGPEHHGVPGDRWTHVDPEREVERVSVSIVEDGKTEDCRYCDKQVVMT